MGTLLSFLAWRRASPSLAKLSLAQEALAPSSRDIFLHAAGVGAIGSEATPLGPAEKLGEQRKDAVGLVRRAGQLVMQPSNVLAL